MCNMQPQETEFYQKFYKKFSHAPTNELYNDWWIPAQHNCQEYRNINDVDYIIISVCEDLFKARNEHMEIFEKRKEFLHENE